MLPHQSDTSVSPNIYKGKLLVNHDAIIYSQDVVMLQAKLPVEQRFQSLPLLVPTTPWQVSREFYLFARL